MAERLGGGAAAWGGADRSGAQSDDAACVAEWTVPLCPSRTTYTAVQENRTQIGLMAQCSGPFPILQLSEGLLERVIGCLDLWDLAAARSSCGALRAAAGRRARRLCFCPTSLLCERGGDRYVQVGNPRRSRAPAA
jgi:hypothetical protein